MLCKKALTSLKLCSEDNYSITHNAAFFILKIQVKKTGMDGTGQENGASPRKVSEKIVILCASHPFPLSKEAGSGWLGYPSKEKLQTQGCNATPGRTRHLENHITAGRAQARGRVAVKAEFGELHLQPSLKALL